MLQGLNKRDPTSSHQEILVMVWGNSERNKNKIHLWVDVFLCKLSERIQGLLNILMGKNLQ